MAEKQKYSAGDVGNITDPGNRTAKALLFVANELHNIYSVLRRLEEKGLSKL